MFNNHGGCWARWFFSISIFSFIYFCSSFCKCILGGLVVPLSFSNFGSLCYPGCLEILYMWCCFSVYTIITVPIHSFLVLRVDHMHLHVVILLVMFKNCMCIFLYLSCVCCQGFLVSLGKLSCSWQRESIFDLHVALYILYRVFRSSSQFDSVYCFVCLCSSQYKLLSLVIPRIWVLSL